MPAGIRNANDSIAQTMRPRWSSLAWYATTFAGVALLATWQPLAVGLVLGGILPCRWFGGPPASKSLAGTLAVLVVIWAGLTGAWEFCLAIALVTAVAWIPSTSVIPKASMPHPPGQRQWHWLAFGWVALLPLAHSGSEDLVASSVILLVLAHQTGDPARTLAAAFPGTLLAAAVLPNVALATLLAGGGTLLAAWHPGPPCGRRPFLALVSGLAGLHLGGPLGAAGACVGCVMSLVLWSQMAPSPLPAWMHLPPFWRWFTGAKSRLDPVYALLMADSMPWGKVLDAGCGHGQGAVMCARRRDVERWEGIDQDAHRLAAAAHLMQYLPKISGGWHLVAGSIPGPNLEVADTILALDVLHYGDAEQQHRMLDWLRRHARTGGICWVREGITDDARFGTVLTGERFTTTIGLDPAGGLHFTDTAGWESRFTAAGWRVDRCQPAGGANRLWRLVAA